MDSTEEGMPYQQGQQERVGRFNFPARSAAKTASSVANAKSGTMPWVGLRAAPLIEGISVAALSPSATLTVEFWTAAITPNGL
jgi:hypothetical protein